MDMRMPVMDGLEATRKIREFDQDVFITCMSANVYKEDKLAAQRAGMDDFIEETGLTRATIGAGLLRESHQKRKSPKNLRGLPRRTREEGYDSFQGTGEVLNGRLVEERKNYSGEGGPIEAHPGKEETFPREEDLGAKGGPFSKRGPFRKGVAQIGWGGD